MYLYENVLLEIKDKGLTPSKPFGMGVFINHDPLRRVGTCTNFRVEPNGLYGDIESTEQINGLYPSLGYTVKRQDSDGKSTEGVIYMIGVCTQENEDINIPCITGG